MIYFFSAITVIVLIAIYRRYIRLYRTKVLCGCGHVSVLRRGYSETFGIVRDVFLDKGLMQDGKPVYCYQCVIESRHICITCHHKVLPYEPMRIQASLPTDKPILFCQDCLQNGIKDCNAFLLPEDKYLDVYRSTITFPFAYVAHNNLGIVRFVYGDNDMNFA